MPKETKEKIIKLKDRYTECLNDPRNEEYRVALSKIMGAGLKKPTQDLTSHESRIFNSYVPIISHLEENRRDLVRSLLHVSLKQLIPEITTFDFEWIMDNVSKINVRIDAPYENLGSIIRCSRSDLKSIIEETFGRGSYNVEIIDHTLQLFSYDIYFPPGITLSDKISQSPVVIEGPGKEGTFIDTLRAWGIKEAP